MSKSILGLPYAFVDIIGMQSKIYRETICSARGYQYVSGGDVLKWEELWQNAMRCSW